MLIKKTLKYWHSWVVKTRNTSEAVLRPQYTPWPLYWTGLGQYSNLVKYCGPHTASSVVLILLASLSHGVPPLTAPSASPLSSSYMLCVYRRPLPTPFMWGLGLQGKPPSAIGTTLSAHGALDAGSIMSHVNFAKWHSVTLQASVNYFYQRYMSYLRRGYVLWHDIFKCHVACHWVLYCMLSLKNVNVAVSILAVECHRRGYPMCPTHKEPWRDGYRLSTEQAFFYIMDIKVI